MIAAREIFTMTLDQDQQRAEKNLKKEERARDGRKAMTEYETQARATREKTERLKALRLAKDAQAQAAARQADQATSRTPQKYNSSLNSAALHPGYAANSAPPRTCAGVRIRLSTLVTSC